MKHLILLSLLVVCVACKAKKIAVDETPTMQLLHILNLGEEENLISSNPNSKMIDQLITSLDWMNFHQIILMKPNGDLMEVGGSLGKGGLTVLYQEKGVIYVIDTPPESVEEFAQFLSAFLRGDDSYKQKYIFK